MAVSDVPDVIIRLLAANRLQRVAVNVDHAIGVIEVAERHVETARLLADTSDQAMAFTAAYDGARKALAAVLASEGLRVRAVGGAHRDTAVAAAEYAAGSVLDEFEWMRQVRNATEYPSADRPTASPLDVTEAIAAASAIVALCAQHVHRVRQRGDGSAPSAP